MRLTKIQKEGILANLSSVLVSQDGMDTVAKAVLENDITMSELQNTGQLTPQYQSILQKAIEELRVVAAEDSLWQQAQTNNDIATYHEYLNRYPAGRYAGMAGTLIAGLKAQQQASQKYQYIEALRHDINSYNTTILNHYGVTYDDIITAGIEIPDRIKDIWSDAGLNLVLGNTPDSIPKGRTEIYFWGAPGSGKTCTLAAVLSTAKKRGYFSPQQGSGLMYMTQLSSLFSDDAATLPPSTSVEVTQALSFNLRDANFTEHPVSLIEISGEIFQCFSQAINGQDIPDDGHLTAYKSLLGFLCSKENPKYHFFVIDVNNTKRDAFGLAQMDYLTNAALFFNDNQIFNDSTAGMNILVTKSDLLGHTPDERKLEAIRLLKENYINFINSLKTIACQHHLIRNMNDMISVIPFTLGEVYLQNKCIFDPTMSDEVIKMLQQDVARTYAKRKLTHWLNW